MIQTNVISRQYVYIHKETTNKSFMDMYYYLKRTGRKNNSFHLILYDSGLAGVNPFDPALPANMKARVLRECVCNYWYFLREIVRVPDQGGDVGGGKRYQLNRGNLAMNFLFTVNYNMFVELPRQFGKTVGAVCRYLWVYNFGTSNSEIMFVHKDHSGSKGNLKKLREIRDALPDYLQMSTVTGVDGKKLKVPNTIISMEHPLNHNKITTFASARSRDSADKMGRGCTMPMQYYDEFAFMLYNQYAYTAAMPAFSTAAINAKNNHAPYGILITTTPGDLTTEQGLYAFNIRNNATEWSEEYYDYTYQQLEELRLANKRSAFFLIRYTYQQLGRGNDYFNDMCTQLNNDWAKIRREILLEWAMTSSSCPFKEEDLENIKRFCREPIRTIHFGKAGQYQFKVYSDLDPRFPPIIGVDVSGAMYQDSSAITVVDSKTTMVTATLNCNFMPTDDLADVLYVLVNKYMPNAVINIERNGGFGASVIQRLVKTNVKKNLYYEIKEKVVEEERSDVRATKKKRVVKVFGLDSTRDVRARLIEILYDRVAYHKDKFIAPILHQEMSQMEVKKSGKVEHSSTTHDDQVFSYLMAMYVWYDGENVMENFNIQKNTIKTDDGADIEDFEDGINNGSMEEINVEITDEENQMIKEQIDYIKDSTNKIKLGYMFNNELYASEEQMADMLYNTNKAYREAYNKKYNVDENDMGVRMNITIPDSVFLDDDYEESVEQQRNGNLYDIFIGL